MKGTLQLVSLLLTVIGVVYCNYAVKRPLHRLQPRYCKDPLVFVSFCLSATLVVIIVVWLNIPELGTCDDGTILRWNFASVPDG